MDYDYFHLWFSGHVYVDFFSLLVTLLIDRDTFVTDWGVGKEPVVEGR